MKKFLFGLILCYLIVGGMGSSANALSVNQLLTPFVNNVISDNSAAYLINANGRLLDNAVLPSDFTVDVGDRIRGWFAMDNVSIGGPSVPFGTSGNDEFSGAYDITVVQKTETAPGSGIFNFFLAPTPGFALEVATLFGEPLAAAKYAGVGVALFDDPSPDFQRSFGGPIAGPDDLGGNLKEEAMIATATDGAGFWALGFPTGMAPGNPWGAGGEFWSILNAPDNISIFSAIPFPGIAGGGNIGLNLLYEPGGFGTDPLGIGVALVRAQTSFFAPVPGSVFDATASGSQLGIAGVAGGTPGDFFDDFNMTIQPIPEPATMLLLGSGLIGLAGLGRRRFFKKG